MKFQFIVQFFVLTLLFSCTKNTELTNALEMAGANRTELEKVLTHYSKNPGDSLKLRAAEFLISNMVYHHTFEHKNLKSYYAEMTALNYNSLSADKCHNKIDSLSLKYNIESKDLKIKYDLFTIKAVYLIKNIDIALDDWCNNPWVEHLSFEEFCEYVLPYRLENENLEDWRATIKTKFQQKIKWAEVVDDARNSTYWAARHLTDSLQRRGYHIYAYKKAITINCPPSVLENIKLGPCDHYAQSTIFIMRACGIPICIDFTPQWPNRSMGHTWNVLFDESGVEIPFMGGQSAPGFPNRQGDLMAKVYRKTFAYQYESLFHIKRDEQVPALFNTPYIKDVTHKYIKSFDTKVKLLKKTDNNFAYLAVFDNSKWIPIQWGKITHGNHVEFKAMGKNCMYMPVIYTNGDITSVGNPFFISTKNKVIEIKPDLHSKQKMYLLRKYPIKRTIYIPSRNILGTTIIASNDLSFKDSAIAGIITRDPKFSWDTLQSKTKNTFRYWKIRGNIKSTCNIAEFQFLHKNKIITDTTNLSANILVSDKNKATFLFDNDILSFVDFRKGLYEWIVVDLGKPVAVDYFRFLPRNDDNAIVAGDSYELMIWDKTGWKSLIKCTATSNKLILRNVPAGGLYLLHNHTKGNEERIFTYENGKQVWW